MFLATMLNYMDRQALANSAPFIMDEFGLTNGGYGRVELAFGLAFACGQVCAGFLVDRLLVRWVYAGGVLAWSAVGFATGFVPDVSGLILCRVLLGVFEAVNWPAAVRVTQRVLPPRDRTLGNGIFNSGGAAGAVITPFVVSWLVTHDHPERWRVVFQVLGVVGLRWAAAWVLFVRGNRREAIERGFVETRTPLEFGSDNASFWSLFLDRRIWIVLVVSIAVNMCWHFYRVWLPLYLVQERGYDRHSTMQFMVAAYFIAADVGSIAAGLVTKRLVLAGSSVLRARWLVMAGCAVLTSLSALVVVVPTEPLFILLMMFVALGNLGQFAGFFAFSQDVSPRHTALVLGLVGSIAWAVTAPLQPYAGAFKDQLGTFVPLLVGIGFVPWTGVAALAIWPTSSKKPKDPNGSGV